MELLPTEIIFFITRHLNLRSLIALSSTCAHYNFALKSSVKCLKKKLFTPAILDYDDDTLLIFYPGPAIYKTHLTPDMPIDGIYFFDGPLYQNGRAADVNFFYHHFGQYLKTSSGKYIASITTKTREIHQHDLGCLYKGEFLHYNDDDDYGDYKCIFAFGKAKMKEFWQEY